MRNRGFEDANLPPACVREGSFIVPPRTAHFDTGQPSNWRLRWDETNPHPAWTIEPATGATATIGLSVERPLNDATPHSLQVDTCLLYTSDAADERSSVDLGGRRIIKKKTSRNIWTRASTEKIKKKTETTSEDR